MRNLIIVVALIAGCNRAARRVENTIRSYEAATPNPALLAKGEFAEVERMLADMASTLDWISDNWQGAGVVKWQRRIELSRRRYAIAAAKQCPDPLQALNFL